MVRRWRLFGDFLRPVFPASRVQHASDLHRKFALRPQHVWKYGSNISSRCPHNMVNFGLLAAEIGPAVWGTQANFNGFRFSAALLHGSQVVGASQTLRR